MMQLPHKSAAKRETFDLKGHRTLIITTSQSTLDEVDPNSGVTKKTGKATGVYASEMTEPYYVFLEAGMDVDIASIQGGKIPIEKLSLMPFVRTSYDSRYLKDLSLQKKVESSIPIANINVDDYDIIFISGGWGAAYDLAQSEVLSDKISKAYAKEVVLGALCHGALGFIGAQKPDGSPLVEDVKITGVTNKQLKELMVGETPKHPETELKTANAKYTSKTGLIDMFKSHIEVDKKHLIVTGQNQKCGVETAQEVMRLFVEKSNQ
ncbi:MAG: putative intracellular protease/amidase [Bacteroidia bacterium]|jgi:putative intracellular protease/amidase